MTKLRVEVCRLLCGADPFKSSIFDALSVIDPYSCQLSAAHTFFMKTLHADE